MAGFWASINLEVRRSGLELGWMRAACVDLHFITTARFYRAMLSIRGTSHGPVSVCPSVCLFITSRCSVETAERNELGFGM